jgi:hypothetical protein
MLFGGVGDLVKKKRKRKIDIAAKHAARLKYLKEHNIRRRSDDKYVASELEKQRAAHKRSRNAMNSLCDSNTDDSDFTPEVAVPTCQASARKRHRSRVPVASDDNASGGISNVAQPSGETITKHYFPPRA